MRRASSIVARGAVALAALVAVLPAVASGSGGGARHLSVDEAVGLALRYNPQLRAVRARARGAADTARSSLARMLSPIRLSDEYQYWDSPFEITFKAGPSELKQRARDQGTNTFTVSGDQPLVGLWRLGEEHAALGDASEAAEAQTRAAEAAVTEAVRTDYLRYFEARAMQEIARTSQQQLAEQVRIMESKLQAGVVTRADLLRLQVAVANARQQEIQAEEQEQVARADLLAAMGVDDDVGTLDFAEPTTLLGSAGAASPAFDVAYRSALARRPELRLLERQASAAHHQERARWLSLLPDVDLEAAYLRVDGQIFLPANSGYIGLKAQWAVWEWGASWYARRAAGAQAEAASLLVDDQRHQVGREIATRMALARAAESAVRVAETTIASAEEAYRVTDALVRAGSATTTDLLDAQGALTQAKLNLTRARYQHAVARVSLDRSLGQ